jgi:hypothetical protein
MLSSAKMSTKNAVPPPLSLRERDRVRVAVPLI